MLLADVAAASADVAATSSRLAKTTRLSAVLAAATDPDELAIVVGWLAGEPRQRRTGIGWASLRGATTTATVPTLTVAEVDAAFTASAELSGAGSAAARRALVGRLFAAATQPEQRFLTGLLSGELRQGALEAALAEAAAAVFDVPVALVRRAAMLAGGLPGVVAGLRRDGPAALDAARLHVGSPVQPMLAATASSVPDAVTSMAGAAVDTKVDGIRIQVHRSGPDVAVFSRSLDDVTARMPEIVAAALAMPVSAAVFDGEAIALAADGRPLPFQQTGARAATRGAGGQALSWFVFDLLHLDGADIMDAPLRDRIPPYEHAVPMLLQVPRIIIDPGEITQAEEFFASTIRAGHEGVVVKDLDSAWEAGRRGAAWRKVKPVHTLDLVVLAAEWGHGRRKGWLSNLHLGAQDPATGGFVMLGKTFKGLTDAMLREQTEILQRIATGPVDGWVVPVEPSFVVEVAFDGVQTSSRYPGGVTLRFARVVRFRPDKAAADADTLDAVRALR